MIGQDFMEKAAGACGDFFERIDELLLLDFPGEEEQEEIGGGGEIGGGLEGCTLPPVSAAGEFEALSGSYAYSGDSACSVENDFAAGLSVPCEDIEQLEWLSNFFEDSFSDEKLFFSGDDTKDSSRYQTPSPVSVLETQPVQLSPERLVPGRARSKRPRPASFSPRTELSTGSEECPRPKKMKEEKKKRKKRVDSVRVDSVQARRCKHCGIEKTPQWRMGPTGPKTLCNACGVRYKSGRLFPEYRPAASPTFVEAIHSNSHKKVMEMRLKFGKGAI